MLGSDCARTVIVGGLIYLLAFVPTSRADWLYLVHRDGTDDKLIRVDPDSQESETIGPMGFNYRFGSMVWHAEMQQLLLVNTRPRDSDTDPTLTDFYWVDPSTAASQHLGSLNIGVQSSLVGYGITIDDKKDVFISFTDLETYQSQVYEVTLDPLSAELALNIGSISGEIDSLEFDPGSGNLLSTPANVGANPANVYSIDLESGSTEIKCTVQLPDNFHENPERGLNNSGLTYDTSRALFWVSSAGNPLVQLNLGDACTSNPIDLDAPSFDSDAIAYVPVDPAGFVMNPGLNDAWFNPDTNGQGVLLTVFPDGGTVFLAWFTFDTERPLDSYTAVLGEPGHRWITAQGPINGNRASLVAYSSSGGVFDSENPTPHTDPIGSVELSFESCSSGLIEYNLTVPEVSGSIPIQRIANDNVALCEALKVR